MNRRGFLQSLMIGASALAIDPERLLWTPGTKTIFIPRLLRTPPKTIYAEPFGELCVPIYDGQIALYDYQARQWRVVAVTLPSLNQ